MNNKIYNQLSVIKFLFVGLLFVVMATSSYGQSMSDIQNIKVDDLSDAQLEQLIKRAESSGMTEQQLEAMARERGMPATEVAKLRQRINQIRNKRNDTQSSVPQNNSGREWNQPEVLMQEKEIPMTEQEKKIFGFFLFRNNNFAEVTRTPESIGRCQYLVFSDTFDERFERWQDTFMRLAEVIEIE